MEVFSQFQVGIGNCNWARERIIAVIITLILIFLATSLCGCMGYLRVYDAIRSEVPITLFNQYEVDLHGYEGGGSGFLMRCDVYFLTVVPADSPITDIPILIIDELCFSGDCLDDPVCRPTRSWAETVDIYPQMRHDWRYGKPLPGRDLWVKKGVIIPGGFDLEPGPYFAGGCYGPVISVEIRARLLDRVTGAEIARDSKIVMFEIRRTPAG